MTLPRVHYEFNEAFVFSDAGETDPEAGGGSVKKYSENFANGKPRVSWSARTCANGRYFLDGPETSYYENGQKEHGVTYINGRKTGEESFWSPDGKRVWTWTHHPENNTSTWVRYGGKGQKLIESNWNTHPRARDLDCRFFGLVADGPVYHWKGDGSPAGAYSFKNGTLIGPLPGSATAKQ
jgi:hypothetical protein